MEQQTIQTYRHEDQCNEKHCKHCNKCLKNVKQYSKLGNSYCKKCYNNFVKALACRNPIYINKEIQTWINYLTNFFCLDHVPIVILKYRDTRKFVGSCHGRCYWSVSPIVIQIWTDYKGHFDLKTLIHEFLHACGYNHEYEINGWANFGYGEGKDRDRYSRLLCRDLTGKESVIL